MSGDGERARFEPVPGAVVVDKYRIERVLGEGGMGVVVAATHLALDQRVAIKFLRPEAMRHKEAVERFQREAKVAAKVQSEHVTRVHDVGTLSHGEPFIVMEHLEGIDLRGLLERGPLPIAEACEIGLQASEALAQVHAAGIVHRDLKPSNLFVTRGPDGSAWVKLLDFGISKFGWEGEPGADPALTATATIMGSPSYMSPEQLRSTKEVDARTDVWSLGAVLYEALAGRPAFRGETLPQVCAMIASDVPPPPSKARAEVPARLDQAVLACLEKNPDNRASLVELARVLVDFAPDRARVSLERIEAVFGETGTRPRAPTSASLEPRREPASGELPILALSAAGRGRTLSSSAWGGGRGRGGGGRLGALALLVAGVVAIAALSGRLDLKPLGGRVAGASGAVASSMATAPAPEDPRTPTALATGGITPSDVPHPPPAAEGGANIVEESDDASPEEESTTPEEEAADEEEGAEALAQPASVVSSPIAGVSARPVLSSRPGKPGGAAKHRPKPKHGAAKGAHKRH